MNIGIFFAVEKSKGGIYQYTLTFINSLLSNDIKNHKYFIIEKSRFLEDRRPFLKAGWRFVNYYGQGLSGSLRRWLFHISKKVLSDSLVLSLKRLHLSLKYYGSSKKEPFNIQFDRLLRTHNIDLIFYPTTEPQSFQTRVPYVITIHDIQHRLHPEFPEVSRGGIFEMREYIYKNAIKKAFLLLVDSEIGKEDVIKAYGVSEEKIKVLPYVPNLKLVRIGVEEKKRLKNRYRLPEKYLFYPAGFWPHKNHFRVVKALSLLREKRGVEIPVVFVGPKQQRWGEFKRVMCLVKTQRMENQVRYLGYVPAKDIPSLYFMATALIIPTFFGPTNLPVYEAWSMGVPVISSNIRGIKEQVGDAALLVDPEKTEEIASTIFQIWSDEELRKQLIKKGLERSKQWKVEDFRASLANIIRECEKVLKQG